MAKKLAMVFGIVFVLVGILGFIPNPIVGTEAFFHTDTLHNIVHLLVGIILVIVAKKSEDAAALWLKIFGVVYLVLFINGLITPDMLLGFVEQNHNDTWLHLVLGLVLVIAGFLKSKDTMAAPMMNNPTSTM